MSPPLETVLMMQYKLSLREARGFVTEGRSNLGQQDAVDWDERLLCECTKLIETQQTELDEKTTGSAVRREQGGSAEALNAPVSVSKTDCDEHPDWASIESRRIKSVTSAKSWTSGTQKSLGTSDPSVVRPKPIQRRSYIDHYLRSEDGKDGVVDETEVGDNHSEATAADIGCNVSISERSVTSREDDFVGEVCQERLNVDEMTTRNEVIVKQAMQLTKAHALIKKTDEESTVTTFESSVSDIPAIIYVVRDISHLNRNTKSRSILNRGKPKNLLGRLRKSFVKTKPKGSDLLLDEDSPEAYENTFVSI